VLATDLRDASYEPIRGAELEVTVVHPDGRSGRMYPRDLPEEPGHYEYRVFLDQPGAYRLTARYGKLDSVRQWVAGSAAGEFTDLSADRPAMERLAKAAGGALGLPEDLGGVLEARPVGSRTVRDLEVWNSPLLVILFLLFLSADCFLRKRQGMV
jgi:hypothetical protein